jgi:hypothetical protein
MPFEDILKKKKQNHLTKVQFVNDLNIKKMAPKNKNLLARVTVISIKLYDLPKMNFLEPNSPFVKICCGDWNFVTEIFSYAGFYLLISFNIIVINIYYLYSIYIVHT